MIENRNAMKKIIIQGISLIVSLLLTVTATFAWLSLSKAVDSNGMQMRIESSPNLVVSTSKSDIADLKASEWADSYITVDWSASAESLKPATHSSGSDTGLIYNTNPVAVSRSTGLKKGDTELTFSDVPTYEDGNARYYIDYVIYIASIDSAMTQGSDYSNLTFSIAETTSLTGTNSAYKAASADVYMASASSGSDSVPVSVSDTTYQGTLNLTGADGTDTFSTTDFSTIPLNTSDSIAVLLRCYFDGAVGPDTSSSYINSNAVSTATDAIQFTITIVAADVNS